MQSDPERINQRVGSSSERSENATLDDLWHPCQQLVGKGKMTVSSFMSGRDSETSLGSCDQLYGPHDSLRNSPVPSAQHWRRPGCSQVEQQQAQLVQCQLSSIHVLQHLQQRSHPHHWQQPVGQVHTLKDGSNRALVGPMSPTTDPGPGPASPAYTSISPLAPSPTHGTRGTGSAWKCRHVVGDGKGEGGRLSRARTGKQHPCGTCKGRCVDSNCDSKRCWDFQTQVSPGAALVSRHVGSSIPPGTEARRELEAPRVHGHSDLGFIHVCDPWPGDMVLVAAPAVGCTAEGKPQQPTHRGVGEWEAQAGEQGGGFLSLGPPRSYRDAVTSMLSRLSGWQDDDDDEDAIMAQRSLSEPGLPTLGQELPTLKLLRSQLLGSSFSLGSRLECRVCLEDVPPGPTRQSDDDVSGCKPDDRGVVLGCLCRPGIMHAACAASWFSVRGHATCEICGHVAPGVLDLLPLLPATAAEAAALELQSRQSLPRCRLCRAAVILGGREQRRGGAPQNGPGEGVQGAASTSDSQAHNGVGGGYMLGSFAVAGVSSGSGSTAEQSSSGGDPSESGQEVEVTSEQADGGQGGESSSGSLRAQQSMSSPQRDGGSTPPSAYGSRDGSSTPRRVNETQDVAQDDSSEPPSASVSSTHDGTSRGVYETRAEGSSPRSVYETGDGSGTPQSAERGSDPDDSGPSDHDHEHEHAPRQRHPRATRPLGGGLRLRCDCHEMYHVYHYVCIRRHLIKHRTQRCTWCTQPLLTLPPQLAVEVSNRAAAMRLRVWAQLLLALPQALVFCALWGRVGAEPMGGLMSLPFALVFTFGGNVLAWAYCVGRHPLSPLRVFHRHVMALHVLRLVVTHAAGLGVLLPVRDVLFSCAWLGLGEGAALLMYNRRWLNVLRFIVCDLPLLLVYLVLICTIDLLPSWRG